MQVMYAAIAGAVRELTLPGPCEFVLPGIRWGAFDELLTPAYWCGQVWQHTELGTYSDLRLGRSLAEEVSACLLGGYGMPAELALAAYARLRRAGMLHRTPKADEIETALLEPFENHGRLRKYRCPRQKALYLSACLERLTSFSEPEDDLLFRDRLAELPGIGLKTASWVVRNRRPSSPVAVIDVHILRAGRYLGIFPDSFEPQRNYRELENRFVSFAEAIGVATTTLDSVMWDYMRRLPSAVFNRNNASMKQEDLFHNLPA
jgi:thermostable 8-oxoguanine DNA glycosylase